MMPATRSAYWQEMKSKTAHSIARVAELAVPEDEHDLKDAVAHVMRCGSCNDKAEVLVEMAEHVVACHMLKAHTIPA